MTRIEEKPVIRKNAPSLRRGFAVQALLVAVSLPWVGLAICAKRADQAIRQRHAVEAIRTSGGSAIYDFQMRGGKVLVSPHPPGPDWLRDIVGVDFLARVEVVTLTAPNDKSLSAIADLGALRSLALSGEKLKNGDVLSIVSRLKRLRSLWLYNFTVDEACWKTLGKINSLETLNLWGTKLTSAAVGEIKRLPRLKYLVLGSTETTDAQLRQIAEAKSLEDVGMIDCSQVTDSGLLELRGLPNLKRVTIWGKTKITDQGLDRFQKLAPQVKKLSIDRSVDFSKPAPD